MTRRTSRAVIGCVAAVLTACSGTSHDRALDLGTTSVPSTTVPIGTTIPTTRPPTTVAPATSPPTDPPTTVLASTTTTEPAATSTTAPPSKEDEVRAAYSAASDARLHCAYDPFTCDYPSIAVLGSPMDVQTRKVVAERAQLNLRGVEGKGSVTTEIEGVGFEGDAAFVDTCVYDTGVLYDIADPTDPDDDIVYNDNVDSYRTRWEMRFDGSRWLLFQGQSTGRLIGGNLCAA